jgi:hypothetical protein
MSGTFVQWATDPKRTLEERYGAQLLIENFNGIPVAKDANGNANYEAQRLWRKERELNPAYEPDYSREDAESVAEKLAGMKGFEMRMNDDRPLRDLSFLNFCPNLEKLDLHNGEVRDWTPVAKLKQLKSLWINDRVAQDLRPVGELEQLETVRLFLHCPWPDFSGWDRLTALRELHFSGNPLALSVIRRLPAVRLAAIHHWLDFKVPLRSIHDLPEMPELLRLELINTWRLDGIERSPLLINAEIYGYFDDLAPLSALKHLTHLLISGGRYEGLTPLAGMERLHWLKVRREEPQDYTVLAELPHLHEVEVELCPASKVELASLNAALTPWDEVFATEPPRPLQPLRLVLDVKDLADDDNDSRAEPRDWGMNTAMDRSEARWFAREINRRLDALLGKGWGHCPTAYGHAGFESVDIGRLEDIDRLREIVETLRALLALARYPWRIAIMVDSLRRYERDMDEIADDDGDKEEEFDAERERQDWEDRQRRIRERREFLERKHRLRIQQQFGEEIRPTDFAAPKPPEKEEEVTAGNVSDEPPEYDLGTELRVYLTLKENGCYVPKHHRGLAEMLLDMKAEEPPQDEKSGQV